MATHNEGTTKMAAVNSIQDPISVAQAAGILRWPYHRTLGHIKRSKRITAHKVGWGWIVSKRSVEKFAREQKEKK